MIPAEPCGAIERAGPVRFHPVRRPRRMPGFGAARGDLRSGRAPSRVRRLETNPAEHAAESVDSRVDIDAPTPANVRAIGRGRGVLDDLAVILALREHNAVAGFAKVFNSRPIFKSHIYALAASGAAPISRPGDGPVHRR